MALWDGCIAYWPLADANPPFDGTVSPTVEIADTSGNDNHGHPVYWGDNGITGFDDATFGRAFNFVDYSGIKAPLHSEFETQVFSVNIWAKNFERVNGRYQMFFCKMSYNVVFSWAMYMFNDNPYPIYWAIHLADNSWVTASFQPEYDGYGRVLPLNTWRMLTGTFDGLAMNLYVDGELVDSKPAIGVPYSIPAIPVGVASDGVFDYTSSQLRADLCGAGMWNRALGSDEITTLYNSGAGRAYGEEGVLEGTSSIGGSFSVSELHGKSLGNEFIVPSPQKLVLPLDRTDIQTVAGSSVVQYEEPEQIDTIISPAELATQEEPSAKEKITEMVNKYNQFLDAADEMQKMMGEKLKDRKVRVDPKLNPAVRDAIRRLFGIDTDTITYDMYKKCLDLRSELLAEGRKKNYGSNGSSNSGS